MVRRLDISAKKLAMGAMRLATMSHVGPLAGVLGFNAIEQN